MSKELSLNILEIAKKVQKLEEGSLPDTYPATQVMMSDGVTSVEEKVGIHVLTGTTMADLRAAIGNLTEAQKLTATIKAVTQYATTPILRVSTLATNSPTTVWSTFIVAANEGTYQYKIDSNDGTFVQIQDNGATTVSLSLTSWTLLYFG